jgi:FG-GAP-like repeat/IPT/TIG domain
MKARILVSMSGAALFVVLAVPIWLAAQEQRRSSEPAASPDMDTANPVPLINQPLVPDAVAPGGAGFTLTVNGTGFVAGSVVDWNGGGRATSFISSAQLMAVILASDIATASTASVTVVNPSPSGGTSNVAFLPITTATASVSLNRSDYAVGLAPGVVAVGDFNGDGKLDLAVVNNTSGTVSVLLGNGDGTFQPPVDYGIGANQPCQR